MTPKDVANEVENDVKFNRTTMIQKRLDCLPILVKWQSRKYQVKQDILDWEDSSEDLYEGIVNSIMTDSEIAMTKTTAAKIADKHPDWVKYKKSLAAKKLLLESIEDAIATIKALGYALKDMHLMLHDENL